MIKLNSNLWFGTEESYFALLHAQDRLAALEAAGVDAIKAAVITAGGGRGDDPFALPPMWELQGNVAVVTIDGSLVNGSAGFGRLFGVVGYGDIQQALAEVAMDKNAKSVLLNIDSGGGQVDGVIDTGDMIRALDAVKPVMSYTGGNMASAAFWLGASARSITAAQTAQVGSVGTLIVHMERSQQLKDNGVTATIVRYGKYKALGNPLEPLSEDGKAQLQSLADASGKIFVDYASERRGMTAAAFQKTAGEGRVFMGQQALDVGLVDAVSNMTGAMAQAKSLDKPKAQQQNPPNSRKGVNMKLSKKTVLALAAGLALDKLGLAEPEGNLEGVKLEGAALVPVEDEAKEVAAAFDTRVNAAVTAATAPLTTQVTELTAKVATAEAATTAANGKVALAEAAATTLQSQLKTSAELAAQGAEIIKASMSVMSVALGGAADVGAALTGTELLAEHAKMADAFQKKFPTGGVAAVKMAAKKTDTGVVASPMFMHLAKSLAPAK
jgi:signal peptide peptidase SppA